MSDLRRWFGEAWDYQGCEEKLLLTHDLTEDSIVYEVGGYTGEWAREIVDRYDPHMFIFEPVPEFCETLRRRFKHNQKVRIHTFGLLGSDMFAPMMINGSASRIGEIEGELGERYTFRRAKDVLTKQPIDLMTINIEGGEYDLLPHLIDTGLIRNIRSLMIQFHMLWPSCYNQWKALRSSLNVTHNEMFCYPFVWERWDLRDND
jgi:FkbM family methyltransferase